MATDLHNARLNFVAQLEGITPTYARVGRLFRLTDGLRGAALDGDSSGRARDFAVTWRGSAADKEPSDMTIREAWHDMEIVVAYPIAIGREDDLNEMIVKDRHDIIAALRLSSSYKGIPGNSTQSTGIVRRWRTADELNTEGVVWLLTQRWDTLVREVI